MWVKVDDGFPEHHKVLKAGRLLGVDGCGRVAAVWLEALCYANRHLTDGFIADDVARRFHLDRNPVQVIRVMASKKVGLFHKKVGGWKIHDYENYQFSKAEIEEKRNKERDRKRRVRDVSARTKTVSAVPDPALPVPAPEDQDQVEQRADRAPRVNANEDENPRVLLKLAHSVFDEFTAGRLTMDDLAEELKSRAAHAHIRYDGDRVRKALQSAESQRR